MELEKLSSNKKWLIGAGIGDSKSPVEIGYFEKAFDKLHYHEKVNEYYLVFSGSMEMVVDDKELTINSGDILFVEPGEKHKVIKTSEDLKCFLVKWPHMPPDDKVIC